MVSLATDVGSAPMQVGAVLLLDPATELDAEDVTAALAERIRTVPRLRQRLTPTPPGCGRPVWVDDPELDLRHHLRRVECAAPGDEEAVLAVAAGVVGTPLPRDRPLWRITVVSGLRDGGTALVVAFHHVLADGIGGLAVLANLVDGAGAPVEPAFPAPAPSAAALAADAARSRLAALARAPAAVRRLATAAHQLRSATGAHAVACSLNRPTGPRRSFALVDADLEDVIRTAHAAGASVNDVVLAAVAAALRSLLLTRGESVDRFVLSIPVSARRRASVDRLGNESGPVPIEVPAAGGATERLRSIAEVTRVAKRTPAGASTALLGPLFRVLARLGLFGWFIDRQRQVHSFVTNVRGPDTRLSFLGAPIVAIHPLAVVTGNVTTSFAVLSYAGTLGITVIADPDACPDLGVLRQALQDELDALAGLGDPPA